MDSLARVNAEALVLSDNNVGRLKNLGTQAAGLKGKEPEKLRELAEEFEAVFLSEMLRPMWKGIEAEPPFGGGQEEETFRSLLIDEYGKMLAGNGGVGIADSVLKELLKLQAS